MNEDTNELTEQELSQVSGGMLNEELINTQQATLPIMTGITVGTITKVDVN